MACDAVRQIRQCVVAVVVIGVDSVLRADGDVDNVEDDAEGASNDEHYTDDSRLTITVRVGDRSCDVWLTDVCWLNHSRTCYHGLLLMRLHSDLYTQTH